MRTWDPFIAQWSNASKHGNKTINLRRPNDRPKSKRYIPGVGSTPVPKPSTAPPITQEDVLREHMNEGKAIPEEVMKDHIPEEHHTTRTGDQSHARVQDTASRHTTSLEDETAYLAIPTLTRQDGSTPVRMPKQEVFASIVKPKRKNFFDDGRKTRDNINNVRMANASYIQQQSMYNAVFKGSQLA